MRLVATVLGAWLLACAGAAPASPTAPILFRHVRIFDGRKLTSGDVLVSGETIAQVGTDLTAPNAMVIDGSGKTLLPGLIDAHTHAFRDALQHAIIFGVTTELDMFTTPKFVAAIKQREAAGKANDSADLRSSGILVTSPGGHGTEYGIPIPTLSRAEDAQAFVDARIAEGSDYIKIIYDDLKYLGRSIPTLDRPTLTAAITAAHRRNKLAIVHIQTLTAAREAIAAGADALAHLFVDRDPDREFIELARARGAFVIPTLCVLRRVASSEAGGELADDPRLRPYLTEDERANLSRRFMFHAGDGIAYHHAAAAVKQLRVAGVPLLAGTDAPNPGTTHGASLHQELELLVQAGLTPLEALAAATSVPAAKFHLDDRGRIAPGLRADLVLVEGDPTADIRLTRAIVGVWKRGVSVDRASYRAALERNQAAKQSAPGVPAGSESGWVSDFEEGKTSSRFGAGWSPSTDQLRGGSSTAALQIVAGGAHGSRYALSITGETSAKTPFAWAGAMFTPGSQPMSPVDLSAKKKLRFWAKGDGASYRVMIFAKHLGFMPASQVFTTGKMWKEYTLPLSAFGVDGRDLMGIIWTAGPGPGKFIFQIDDVRFE